jgi:hypothetical protein
MPRVACQAPVNDPLPGYLPYLGKPGRSADTREFGVASFPYLVVYGVEPVATGSETAQVAIPRVLHGAMMWPPADQSV